MIIFVIFHGSTVSALQITQPFYVSIDSVTPVDPRNIYSFAAGFGIKTGDIFSGAVFYDNNSIPSSGSYLTQDFSIEFTFLMKTYSLQLDRVGIEERTYTLADEIFPNGGTGSEPGPNERPALLFKDGSLDGINFGAFIYDEYGEYILDDPYGNLYSFDFFERIFTLRDEYISENGPLYPLNEEAMAVGSLHIDKAPVPEPVTIILLGAGLIGLAGIGRKKFKK